MHLHCEQPKRYYFLCSIDTSSISKTRENVFKTLGSIVDEVGEEDFVQVITDNTANYKVSGN